MDIALKILYILMLKDTTTVKSCTYNSQSEQAEIMVIRHRFYNLGLLPTFHKIRLGASRPGTHETGVHMGSLNGMELNETAEIIKI